MIAIKKEPKKLFEHWWGVYENCYFCGDKTDTWNLKTNTPVCKKCAVNHDIEEIKKEKQNEI